MRIASVIASLLVTFALTSCSLFNRPAPAPELDPGLVREIQALGNRNWIVIADESFPLHTRRGVRTLLVNKEIPEVLGGVLDVLDNQQHVTPVFYRSQELTFVENDNAPGIDAYRVALNGALRGHAMRDFPYRYLSAILEDDSKTFAVLVIKTQTALPYSSIFIELDSGYWDQRAEQGLRQKMEGSGS
ncbi:RbsD/FucU domain-containing protein [Roseibacillus ishigakijimensis]|uniref:D-ribose pyranase n=1 Tax=Roseibacillus ishigakijimensis TaxID=454146 RepID=A0A934RLU2_9BACT|nr:RbsD/FucU domain-containing protein [Roseibacillus ishigakijimensis]MBK1834127.1 hypothetical protein [Roseibacillus ishigakijimensis]